MADVVHPALDEIIDDLDVQAKLDDEDRDKDGSAVIGEKNHREP